ncbi:MAG: squalene--hopene cyclase [Planctomycetaceae bacterium]|nr:squalene--hopene cyclase [Planctomycetaceae bacterium]
MSAVVSRERLERALQTVQSLLLSHRLPQGHWEGKLSTSALSTATAVMALEQVRRQQAEFETTAQPLIKAGINWLATHQNDDGGWGDTIKSFSNISTTMLANAVFHATDHVERFPDVVSRSQVFIDQAGGVPALVARYGKDKTFSVPILTHCALAGLVSWDQIPALPFELSCISPKFYATVQLPVVSYALPALIAIGQVRHHFRKPRNPLLSFLRDSLIPRSLRVLTRIQPENGGFLEAVPLTSFVTMSLAAKGLTDHAVVKKGIPFIIRSVLPDGSWPIDTNLATWVTTLSANALTRELDGKEGLTSWLLDQQYRRIHPYTNAPPGGWAWTDLPGGVPDADDTPGAILALVNLAKSRPDRNVCEAIVAGVEWLLNLQNRDGGWPTFCRGWGALPFDRSSCDITAHCIRAITKAEDVCGPFAGSREAIGRGFRYLGKMQQENGAWLPLWFGNQYLEAEENPVYGTSRVLLAYRDTGTTDGLAPRDGILWLRSIQNEDGGWGGGSGTPSSVEETALAVEALSGVSSAEEEWKRGVNWLIERIDQGTIGEASPIGFYFAKLWYFEELYPLIYANSALRCAAASAHPPTP